MRGFIIIEKNHNCCCFVNRSTIYNKIKKLEHYLNNYYSNTSTVVRNWQKLNRIKKLICLPVTL